MKAQVRSKSADLVSCGSCCFRKNELDRAEMMLTKKQSHVVWS